MDLDYTKALKNQLSAEVEAFGEQVQINGILVKALISQSAMSKNLQVAGFYKNQVLDLVVSIYSEDPKLNQIVLYDDKTYQIKTIEKMEYKSGNRLTIELVP